MNTAFSPFSAIYHTKQKIKKMILNNESFSDPMFGDFFKHLYYLTNDITSLWSCQGHPGEEIWDTPYIMFICNNRGKMMLEEAFDIFITKISLEQMLATGLSTALRLSPEYDVNDYNFKREDLIKTLIWGSRSTFLTEEDRRCYIENFIEALMDVLKKENSNKLIV